MTAATVQTVCLDGVTWCTSCSVDSDGEIHHHATVCPSELLRVEVGLLTGPEAPGDEVTFMFHVHNEPPLLRDEAVQVANEMLATIAAHPATRQPTIDVTGLSQEQQDVVRDLVRDLVEGRIDRDRLPSPAEAEHLEEYLAAIRAAIH